MVWLLILTVVVVGAALVYMARSPSRPPPDLPQEHAEPVRVAELEGLDPDTVRQRVAAIIERNFDAADSLAALRDVAPPGTVIVPSPTWRAARGRLERSCTVLPEYFRSYYYGGKVAKRLREPKTAQWIAEFVSAMNPATIEPELEEVALLYEGDWGEAPQVVDDAPYERGDRPLSLVIADVARCLAAGASTDELRTRYGVLPDASLLGMLQDRLALQAGEEMRAYMGSTGMSLPVRGADYRLDVHLTRDEARRGDERMVEVRYSMQCEACDATGEGATGASCERCDGTGQKEDHRDITVSIPAGIEGGQALRLVGQGQAGEGGGPAGDLYLVFKLDPDAQAERG